VAQGGGAALGSCSGAAALGHRGEVGEVDAAEEEREREAAAKKGEGTVLGVRITATDPVPSAVRCGSALPRCCGASRRGKKARVMTSGAARVREGGAQGAAGRGHGQWPSGRPAGKKQRRGKKEGEEGDDTRGPVAEKEKRRGAHGPACLS
jgi:hypothetical protein